MSDTYETAIHLPGFPDGFLANDRRYALAPEGILVAHSFRKIGHLWYLVLTVSKDEEQPQVPAAQTVQEDADEDIPLDFELTEACFRGLPPGVDAGEKEAKKLSLWEQFVRSYIRVTFPVIPADAEGAPIAGTVEDILAEQRRQNAVMDEIDSKAEGWLRRRAWDAFVADDESVESWAAEAEAKRWRGDLLHIVNHCWICGQPAAPTCADCEPLFDAYWRNSPISKETVGGRIKALAAWDAAVSTHIGFTSGRFCIWSTDPAPEGWSRDQGSWRYVGRDGKLHDSTLA